MDELNLVEFPPEVTYAEPADPEGDLQLNIKSDAKTVYRSLRVSSKVLKLASPVFCAMFASPFKEGRLLRDTSDPSIDVVEEYPPAMELTLRILHHQVDHMPSTLKPRELAEVALQSDKYFCTAAVGPWILYRYGRLHAGATTEEYGYAMLASYIFRSQNFRTITMEAVKHLSPGFSSTFQRHKPLRLLPRSLIDLLSEKTQDVSVALQEALYGVQCGLEGYAPDTYGRPSQCSQCSRLLPHGAKKCNACPRSSLVNRACTRGYRQLVLFAILSNAGLWPSPRVFQTRPLVEIAALLVGLSMDEHRRFRHQCLAGLQCPLDRELSCLSIKVERIMNAANGITLEELEDRMSENGETT